MEFLTNSNILLEFLPCNSSVKKIAQISIKLVIPELQLGDVLLIDEVLLGVNY